MVEVVAPAHQRAAAVREVERCRDRGGAAHRAVAAGLAEIFEQQVAAEREADRQHAVAGELRVEAVEQACEVLGAAGVVLLAAEAAGRAGAALVDPEHGVAAGQEVGGGEHHVAAGLGAGDAVDQEHQRPRAQLLRQMQRGDQAIAAAVLEAHHEPARRLAGQGVVDAPRVVADGLQVTAPPGQARIELGQGHTSHSHGISSVHRPRKVGVAASLSSCLLASPQFCGNSWTEQGKFSYILRDMLGDHP